MAFWGIEVKPGKPFTLTYDGVRRRLHISQATLAIGSSKQTSLVQCNIGNKCPVLLCALLPDKSESLQLNLEFDEDEEVIFSVIGPRGVHLTGYYNGIGRDITFDNESESYGEDIGNSEDEGSVPRSDEDEYEDSFIDDDDNPEVLPPSPVSTDGDEPQNKTCTRKRIKKNYQAVESDNDSGSWQQNTGNCIRSVPENESEDSLPISSLRETKRTAKNKVPKSGCPSVLSRGNNDIPVKDVKPERTLPKKKIKGTSNEGKTPEAGDANHSKAGDEAQQAESKTNKGAVGQDPLENSVLDHDPDNNRESSLPEKSLLPSTDAEKPKKKRKERAKEETLLEENKANHITSHKENRYQQSQQADMEADDVDHDLHEPKERDRSASSNNETGLPTVSLLPAVKEGSESIPKKKKRRKEQDQKTSTEKNIDLVPDKIAEEDISEKKSKKKRKSKLEKNDENVDVDASDSTKGENQATIENKLQEKNVNTETSQVRMLSNGLVIEELESSKSGGKAAAPGRKLKVLYTAKLKESGQIIDSNIGKAPYRFRLGDQQVIEGWNVGLDGMHAGDKRRLVVPPSLGYGSRGTPENVPPNSWLVYDVQVMSIH